MTESEVMESIIELTVEGMTCVSCVAHVEGALTDLEGVTAAEVNLGLGTARIRYVAGQVTVNQMKLAVREAGYHVEDRG